MTDYDKLMAGHEFNLGPFYFDQFYPWERFKESGGEKMLLLVHHSIFVGRVAHLALE